MSNHPIQTKIDRYISDNLERFVGDLARLCAAPSVSAAGEGIEACAALVAAMLEENGFAAEILPTAGNPVVYGEGGAGDRTMLFYLHYDVQPPEPLELWESPPFDLTRRDGRLVARGAADDKGHIIARLAGLAAVRDALGELPCRVKFVIEGEEELGSPNMTGFVRENRDRLAADGCVWEFGGVDHNGAPLQVLGMRGICYVELVAKTASQDAHSGLGGSIFPNAAWRLVWALNSLKGQDERIRLPGFYDRVEPASDEDLRVLAALPDDAEQMRVMYGLTGFLRGLTGGVELRRATVFEPTCTICGITTGYQGPGSKTVLPAEARAKVDFRLVPDQRPEEVLEQLRAHLDGEGFEDVEIVFMGGTYPARTEPSHPLVQMAIDTARQVYGREPVVSPMTGGSGPIHPFIQELGLPVVTSGVGYPGTQIHAPNEHIRLDDFAQGIRHVAYLVEALGRSEW